MRTQAIASLSFALERRFCEGECAFRRNFTPNGTVIYSGNWGAFRHLVTKDGRTFKITFSLVSTMWNPRSRHRLAGITMKSPELFELQADHLPQGLTSRHRLRKHESPKLTHLDIGPTKIGQFSISAKKWWAKAPTPPDLSKDSQGPEPRRRAPRG